LDAIKGSLVALVTPMSRSGHIDREAVAAIVDRQLRAGTAAIVVAGTTGEAATLSVKEQSQLITDIVDLCRGKIPVVAGIGANSTHEAIELASMARDSGAACGLSVVPYYVRPNQDGMVRHFEAIARAAGLPQILYNIPSRTGADMNDQTVAALAMDPLVIGIKDATGDMARASRLVAMVPPGFSCYSGDDSTSLAYMLLGGHGTISVAANVVPGTIASLCAFALGNDILTARALNTRLLPLYRALSVDTNPMPVKYALVCLRMIEEGIRLPLVSLAEDKRAEVDAVIEELAIWCRDCHLSRADGGTRA
jgi:4-hydroxy-tetrahydrodipicolinate synthase